jgi:hypothetical protein
LTTSKSLNDRISDQGRLDMPKSSAAFKNHQYKMHES